MKARHSYLPISSLLPHTLKGWKGMLEKDSCLMSVMSGSSINDALVKNFRAKYWPKRIFDDQGIRSFPKIAFLTFNVWQLTNPYNFAMNEFLVTKSELFWKTYCWLCSVIINRRKCENCLNYLDSHYSSFIHFDRIKIKIMFPLPDKNCNFSEFHKLYDIRSDPILRCLKYNECSHQHYQWTALCLIYFFN